jgi:signal transduction histidine kinase
VLREALARALDADVQVVWRGDADGLPAPFWEPLPAPTVWIAEGDGDPAAAEWAPLDLTASDDGPSSPGTAAVRLQADPGPVAVLARRAPSHGPWTPDDLVLLHECVRATEIVLAFLGRQQRTLDSRAVGDAAAHRGAALARLGERLTLAVEVESVARATLESMVPYLADWALLDFATPAGETERVGRMHADPAHQERLESLAHFPFGDGPPAGALERLGEQGRLLEAAGADALAALAPGEEAGAIEGLDPASVAVVPLVAGGRTVGALTLAASAASGQRYGPADLVFFRSLARQAALALNSARIFAASERARMEREEVLAIVSHDLRNPLNTLGFALSILRQEGIPEDRRAAQQAIMERAMRQMEELVANLLDAARMDAGRLALDRRPQDPATVVHEAVLRASPQAEASGVVIEAGLLDVLPPVLADRMRLMQVFANLLDNAISFTPRGGTVRVRAASEERWVRFEIEDGGPGLPAEEQARVFDRFWQARQSGRAGAGLGLAIARGVVELHGGQIGVRSPPGRGAAFHFTLPRAPDAGETRADPDPVAHTSSEPS